VKTIEENASYRPTGQLTIYKLRVIKIQGALDRKKAIHYIMKLKKYLKGHFLLPKMSKHDYQFQTIL